MKKENFWKISTFFLLGINLCLIGFFALQPYRNNREKGHRNVKPDPIIIDGLGLNEEQILSFEKSKNQHRNAMDRLSEKEKPLRQELFREIAKIPGDSVKVQFLLLELAELKKEKDQATLQHFEEIKALCSPLQLTKYPAVIEEVSEILIRGGGPPRK